MVLHFNAGKLFIVATNLHKYTKKKPQSKLELFNFKQKSISITELLIQQVLVSIRVF
jgi:hypothetical protein